MKRPVTPLNEAVRIGALQALEVLDTPPEERYDRLTRMAAAIMEVPMALVSLVDSDRQWFKSKYGLEADETPRDISFCGHAILGNELFEIPNATQDVRFFDNPLVTDAPNIRFYAGQSLRAPDGEHIGTLCIIDTVPKVLSDQQRNLLADLARMVEQELAVHDFVSLQKRILAEQEERRNYQRQLEESEQRFRSLADATMEGIAICEIGRIVDVNQRLADILSIDRVQLVGREAVSLCAEEDGEGVSDHIALANGVPFRVGCVSGEGTPIPVEIIVSDTVYMGNKATVLVFRDLTERNKIEQLKNDFVSNVSHELRTPLTSIQGSLGWILGGMAGDVSEKLKELLEIAHSNSSRLIALINDILDIQKIESGQMDFQYSTESLYDLIEASIRENEAYAGKHRVKIAFHRCSEALDVRVDASRFKQIMANLLSNAAKFSPENGLVSVGVEAGIDTHEVRVTDSGPGISDEFRSRIFEKFSQANITESRNQSGTGLGLSITRLIVERMGGGAIDFESTPGKGSEFFFTLPRVKKVSGVHVPSVRNRILICEDNTSIADVMVTLLERADYKCDVANTAADALMLLQNNKYLAMTLDVNLPDRDGISFFHDLRSDPDTRDLPVVFISAYGGPDGDIQQMEGAAVGAVNWLQKPVDYDELVEVFRNVRLPVSESGKPVILHVEDDDDVFSVVQKTFGESVAIDRAVSVEEGRRKLTENIYDLVILDISMPDGRGDELLSLLNRHGRHPVLLVIFSAYDPPAQAAAVVARVLQKSKTTIDELCDIVRDLVDKYGAAGKPSDADEL